mmetsp:Transcript_1457/g.2928  ORF Transcript_1457/g.2928 Transcript_1457/m.2928 type:complete len:221 (-) Transcript_1457:480-1142(-)
MALEDAEADWAGGGAEVRVEVERRKAQDAPAVLQLPHVQAAHHVVLRRLLPDRHLPGVDDVAVPHLHLRPLAKVHLRYHLVQVLGERHQHAPEHLEDGLQREGTRVHLVGGFAENFLLVRGGQKLHEHVLRVEQQDDCRHDLFRPPPDDEELVGVVGSVLYIILFHGGDEDLEAVCHLHALQHVVEGDERIHVAVLARRAALQQPLPGLGRVQCLHVILI